MSMGFLGVLMEIYNVSAAVFIIFFCELVVLRLRGMNRDLLKARLFLNDAIIQRTFTFSTYSWYSFTNGIIKKYR